MMCEICSKLTINTPKQHQCCSGVFIVNFEQISQFDLVFLLLTSNKLMLTGFGAIFNHDGALLQKLGYIILKSFCLLVLLTQIKKLTNFLL